MHASCAASSRIRSIAAGLIFEMDEEPNSGDANTANFSDADGEIQIVRDIKDRFEKQTITSFNLGGETFAGAWTFKYNGSWSAAKEREAGSLDPVEFQREFDGDDELDVSFNYGDWRLPRYTLSGGNVAAFSDAEEFEFDKIESDISKLGQGRGTGGALRYLARHRPERRPVHGPVRRQGPAAREDLRQAGRTFSTASTATSRSPMSPARRATVSPASARCPTAAPFAISSTPISPTSS